MPTYEYGCFSCDHQEEYTCRIAERPGTLACPKCSGRMRQIIVPVAIQGDDIVGIPWLQDFAKSTKEARHGEKPIQTRTEYKQFLKDKNLRPCRGENLSEV